MRSGLDKSATPAQKLDFIFNHICNYETGDGKKINREGGTIINLGFSYMHTHCEYFGLQSSMEMGVYLNTLEEQGLIALDKNISDFVTHQNGKVWYKKHGRLTFKGLSYLSEIENRGILSNKCFVAMAFDAKKDERIAAIKTACQEHGFDAFIIEEYKSKENQTIDANIIAAIKSARFCIADFTGVNKGAYMEAGFAMGRNMKVIFVCEETDFHENKKHFDVNHYPFLTYKDFPDLINKLKVEIAAYINE